MDRLLLEEIYDRVQRRQPTIMAEKIKLAIVAAWRAGRLPLIAGEAHEFRPTCRVQPHVWMTESAAGDARGWAYHAELSKDRIVGFLPATASVHLEIQEEHLREQLLPPDIPPADITFDFIDNMADWHDESTGARTWYSGVGASREAVEREWPARLAPKSTKEWACEEVPRILKERPGIGRHALARELKLRLDSAVSRGLVVHEKTEGAIYAALDHDWGLWPPKKR